MPVPPVTLPPCNELSWVADKRGRGKDRVNHSDVGEAEPGWWRDSLFPAPSCDTFPWANRSITSRDRGNPGQCRRIISMYAHKAIIAEKIAGRNTARPSSMETRMTISLGETTRAFPRLVLHRAFHAEPYFVD